MTNKSKTVSLGLVFMALLFWLVMLILHGAIPFIISPTFGQAVWSMGFAQSYANQDLLTVYANNFGVPEPAAMAFGLPGAWLAAVFLKLGFSAPDAYSCMIVIWMSVAMAAAYALARQFDVSPSYSVLAAFGWMSMPIIWAHAGYSMLSVGIALLPLYFLCTFRLLNLCAQQGIPKRTYPWLMMQPMAAILAIFMDGYSFMFYAVGSLVISGIHFFYSDSDTRRRLMAVGLPIQFSSLLAAYLLYSAFIGKSGYEGAALDFFRGWGIDLSFFMQPSQGTHWVPDALGWSVKRSSTQFYGDASVWITTFSLPIFLAGIWAAWSSKGKFNSGVTAGLLLTMGIGFYMALGPSFKYHSTKPEAASATQLMPAEAALGPTGTGILSENLPGLKNMRASYRWTALGVFSAWVLLVLTISRRNPPKNRLLAVGIMGMVIALNTPPLPTKLEQNRLHRTMFLDIQSELVDDMGKFLNKGERILFLPWGNDFLANHIAAKLGIFTFNVGGDKNLQIAMNHWPKQIRQINLAQPSPDTLAEISAILNDKIADALVLPFIDLLHSAHKWPSNDMHRDTAIFWARLLEDTEKFSVVRRPHYIVIRGKEGHEDYSFSEKERSKVFEAWCRTQICTRTASSDTSSLSTPLIFLDGWSNPESWGRWSSGDTAHVAMRIPDGAKGDLLLRITGRPFLAPDLHTNLQVRITSKGSYLGTLNYAYPADAESKTRIVPISRQLLDGQPEEKISPWITLQFHFDAPKSPAELGLSTDARRLSLGLNALELVDASKSKASEINRHNLSQRK